MGAARGRSGNPARRDGALTPYWHGGRPGLSVGSALLPRAAGENLAAYLAHEAPYDQTRVYFTTDRQLARSFAVLQADGMPGSLYNVRPIGEIAPDPDYPTDRPVSFSAVEAVVVRVVETRVRMSEAEQVRATARYSHWPDGSPMYSPEGYLTLSETARANGITEEMLRAVGPWRRFMSVEREIRRMVAEMAAADPAG